MECLLISFIVLIVWLLHWYLTVPYDYWQIRGVPGPKPYLLVGNIGPTLNFSKNPGTIYKEIYSEFQDYLYVGYYKLRKAGILVRDIELVKDILVKQFSSFHDNDIDVDEKLDPLFSRNPFCLKGLKWKYTRSLITAAFTHSKMKNMYILLNNVGKNMIHYLKSKSNDELNCLNTKELAENFTTDAVASCAFGFEAKSFEDIHAEFRVVGAIHTSPKSIVNGIRHLCLFILPSLGKILRRKFIRTELENYFVDTLSKQIEYRQKENIIRNDYLDLLISLQSKPTKYGFDNVDVLAQALTFYVDGYESSSLVMMFTLYEIAANPEIQEKLREEIQVTLEKHDGKIMYDTVQQMTYLDQVVSESLRMYPPFPFMTKVCTSPFELPPPNVIGEDIKLEVGTLVTISITGIHYDPEIYPNPKKFNPERFNEENKNSRSKYAYMPFGEGPRICIGSKFGIAQTKCAVTHILSHYKLSVNKKTQEPLVMHSDYFFETPIGGIWLDFTKL